MIILHLREEDCDGTNTGHVKRIRSKFDGTLVAESSHFLYGRAEIMELFDEYVNIITYPSDLSFLLEKYGFLPKHH